MLLPKTDDESMKFIQITDTHIMAPGGRLHQLSPNERLAACIADINAQHRDARFCIITGDLVDQGDVEAYGQLRAILSNLTIPYHLMIGNHDLRDNFIHAFPETDRDVNGFVQYVVPTPVGDFILLDTVEPGTAAGRLCPARLAWLRDRLDETRGRPVYRFMHHPPFPIEIPCLDRIRLEDPEPLVELIDRYGHIRHLFLGHVHRPVTGCWRGIPFSALRGTNHQVALDWTTVWTVPKSHEPPSYAVVFLQDDLTVVHFHDYLDNSVLPFEAA